RAEVVTANGQGQAGLWRYGISGARPIVLVRVDDSEELALVRQMLLAHTYWRLKGLEADLVIVNEHPTGYLEEMQQQLQNLVRSSDAHPLVDKLGGVFVRPAAHIAEEDRVLLQAAARVVLAGNRGALANQIDRLESPVELPPPLVGRPPKGRPTPVEEVFPGELKDLLFANGLGGFSPDGREYVTCLKDNSMADAVHAGKERDGTALNNRKRGPGAGFPP